MSGKSKINAYSPSLEHLLKRVPAIVQAISAFTKEDEVSERATRLLGLLSSKDMPTQINCLEEVLALALHCFSGTSSSPIHSALLDKERNRLKGKKDSDEEKKQEAKRKINHALSELAKEGKKPTVLEIRFKVNMLFGDAGQRSPGNLMLANPEYHMSATTISRYLKQMRV